MDDDFEPFMRIAVDEAVQSPPDGARVGVVIVRDGVVLVKGHKGEDGTSKHAEAVALAKALEGAVDVRGATAFVTLEPCANLESKRICCADLLADAGVATVYIGRYDRNPRVNRQGWRALRDRGIRCCDFTAAFRNELDQLNVTFDGYFLRRNGLHGTAKFDHSQNGHRYNLATDDSPSAPVWTTSWHTCGVDSIYAHDGRPGNVALARFAQAFDDIDDPDAYDYESASAELNRGDIAIYRNEHGHALVRLLAVEPPPPYGDTPHVSIKIDYELRPYTPTTSDHDTTATP